jgi:hypothetical protein
LLFGLHFEEVIVNGSGLFKTFERLVDVDLEINVESVQSGPRNFCTDLGVIGVVEAREGLKKLYSLYYLFLP